MELQIGETQLKCYEDGKIERFHKRWNRWTECKGHDKDGYLLIGIEGKLYYFHRLIFKAFNPEMDETLVIDHINRIKNDNRLENLRLVTQQQNTFNTDAKGYRKNRTGFQAKIMLNGVSKTKTFKTEDEAKNWYMEQKLILHII